MHFLVPLSLFTCLAAAVAVPPNQEKPYPMPSIVPDDKPVTPFPMPSMVPDPKKPMLCTKICALTANSLKCGKGWAPRKSGECWACCKVEKEEDDEDGEDEY